ncbi:MAG: 3-isopropylmalate dehydratase small subunit [Pigmentiphaga sp.]|nr:3-isopropylmalate dehydratase small subunit [Pigmentiphaga sp.]
MNRFTTLHGTAAPLPLDNVDTDMIIRVEPLFSGVPREQLGAHALAALRYRPDGSADPDFVLNRPEYADATILVTGSNFGCGSSREGAVWALAGLGIRAVVAPGFGEIFFNNCFENGLLPIRLAANIVRRLQRQLAEGLHGRRLGIDLERCELTAPDGEVLSFAVPRLKREALLEGLDSIAVTQKRDARIAAYQDRERQRRPWLFLVSKP